MRDTLAEMVLARVVDWDAEKLSEERLDLELMAELKYDEYRQFSAGMRFIESMSLWLGQFDSGAEQNTIYELVKRRLVFISSAEMQHYIRMAHADHAKPVLVGEAARRSGICENHVAKVTRSKEFGELQRKCLYLGLSDGSRMDDFRRFSNLRHEQVYPTYEISIKRRKRMVKSLAKSLGQGDGDAKFEVVFLIDDFSASGISYIREKNGKHGGKIAAFLQQFDDSEGLEGMFTRGFLVVVLLYVATDRALSRIRKLASKLLEERGIRLEVVAVHEIREAAASLAPNEMAQAEAILEKQFDRAVATAGYKMGRHRQPYLGFDECGLLVVLNHNCPNNTLPIIWHESDDAEIRALFPRHERFAGE